MFRFSGLICSTSLGWYVPLLWAGSASLGWYVPCLWAVYVPLLRADMFRFSELICSASGRICSGSLGWFFPLLKASAMSCNIKRNKISSYVPTFLCSIFLRPTMFRNTHVYLLYSAMSWHVTHLRADMFRFFGLICSASLGWYVPLLWADMFRFSGLICSASLGWYVPLLWADMFRASLGWYVPRLWADMFHFSGLICSARLWTDHFQCIKRTKTKTHPKWSIKNNLYLPNFLLSYWVYAQWSKSRQTT